MALVVGVVSAVLALVVVVAWMSDRRDRARGRTSFRSASDMSAITGARRRSNRWQRAHINREIIPPKDINQDRP